MQNRTGARHKKWCKRYVAWVGIIAVALLALVYILAPVPFSMVFEYVKGSWGDFQYQGGWYEFDEERDNIVSYVHPGFFQKGVVVPASVKYKGQTYQVENIGSRVAEYRKDGANAGFYSFLLKSFVISEGVNTVQDDMLMWSNSVEYVEIPGTCKVLGNGSFAGCGNIREVVLHEGVEIIGDGAFDAAGTDVEVLKVEFPNSVQYIKRFAFRGVELERLELPANLIEIEYDAFENASWRENPSKCTIPPKVVKIAHQGLGSTLAELIFEGITPPDIQYDMPTVIKVTVPQGCLEIYQAAYDGKFNENVVYVEAELK